MANTVFKIAILVFGVPLFVFAQESKNPQALLEHITGDWVLQGTIAGQETTHDISAKWILNHEYIQLHEISREKDDGGKPAYEAIVHIGWDAKGERFTCLWLDNTGAGGLIPEAIGFARFKGNIIEFLFDGGDGTSIHNTFTFDPEKDTWQWKIDNDRDGEITPFALVNLIKK